MALWDGSNGSVKLSSKLGSHGLTCGSTTLVVMEEWEMRSACARYTQEMREKILAERQNPRKLKKSNSQCVSHKNARAPTGRWVCIYHFD
jgi:hypothetical protein